MTLVLVSDFLKMEEERLKLKSNEKEQCRENGVPPAECKYVEGKSELNGLKGSQLNCDKGEGKLGGKRKSGKRKVGRSRSSKVSKADKKKKACVVTCNLSGVELDGQWGVVISHEGSGGQKSAGDAPVILRVALPSSSPSCDESMKKITESGSQVKMEMKSSANDMDELISSGEDDEAQMPSKIYEKEDMVKRAMWSSKWSSPNCTVELLPILGIESGLARTPVTEIAKEKKELKQMSSDSDKMKPIPSAIDESSSNKTEQAQEKPQLRPQSSTARAELGLGEGNFQCRLCFKSFKEAGDLKKHFQYHLGYLRLHQCQWCSKRFYYKGDLAGHMRVHTAERLHRCQYCPKRFARKKCLKNHILTHSRT